MTHIITYTTEDSGTFTELTEEDQRERTRTKLYASKIRALGFRDGVHAAGGTVLKMGVLR